MCVGCSPCNFPTAQRFPACKIRTQTQTTKKWASIRPPGGLPRSPPGRTGTPANRPSPPPRINHQGRPLATICQCRATETTPRLPQHHTTKSTLPSSCHKEDAHTKPASHLEAHVGIPYNNCRQTVHGRRHGAAGVLSPPTAWLN